MATTQQGPTVELENALFQLEDRLETPVVPGEMVEWCRQVQAAFEGLRTLYEDRVRPSHERQFAAIRNEDPALDTRTSQLASEDEAIVVELERLGSILNILADHVDPQAETAEDLGTGEQLPELVREMLAVVIRIRTFEKAVQTWYVEAFQRDRGVVD